MSISFASSVSNTSELKQPFKILQDVVEFRLGSRFLLGDEAAVDFQLRFGARGTNGNPGAIWETVFEEVRRRQPVEPRCIIEAFAVLEESGTAVAQGGHDSANRRQHHPWERGTNENTNGLLREFFPKGKDITDTPEDYIQRKYHELNLRPRKCLGYKIPYEVYFSKVLHLA